jgi:hypothetical protein
MYNTQNVLLSILFYRGGIAVCGRFAQKSPTKKIAKKFKVEEAPPLAERYNVAPS